MTRSRTPVTFHALMDVMPKEPWPTVQDQQQALSNALTRLRVKHVLKQVEGGWVAA